LKFSLFIHFIIFSNSQVLYLIVIIITIIDIIAAIAIAKVPPQNPIFHS